MEQPESLPDLFRRFRSLAPEERERQLARLGDAQLVDELRSLLAAHEEEHSVLDRLAETGILRLSLDERSRLVGEKIGNYRVVEFVAAGGMGTVYKAIQERPRRTVALKVVHRALMNSSVLRRFHTEAELLARFDHPCIAKVFEAATFSDGSATVPYVAMEYVEGSRTITAYADERKLDPKQRLELFAKVCDAVHHGHQKGIIHRDLKPENILIGANGEPKVIDFGVARVTDADLSLTTRETDAGIIIGTLPYMSPEQVSGDHSALDTRSDVYALGVVLFELMCGSLPLNVRDCSLPEAAYTIAHKPPQRLRSLRPGLESEIEAIAEKTLEKSKERRYSSAAELGADIERFLADEPVLAQPISGWYRFSKFAKRNKAAFAGAAATTLALIVGLVLAIQQAILATRARDESRAQLQQASIATAALALRTHDVSLAARSLEAVPEDLRGWEWRHLASQVDHSSLSLSTPERLAGGTPWFMIRKGRSVVGLSREGAPGAAWDAASGEPLPLSVEAALLAVSADGLRRAWLQGDALIVDAPASDREGVTIPLPGLGRVFALALSPTGRFACLRDETSARRIDLRSGRSEEVPVARGVTGIHALAVSDEGTAILADAIRRGPALWKAGGKTIETIPGLDGIARSVAITKDGQRIVAGLQDTTIKLIDRSAPERGVTTGRGHLHAVTDIAFSPDGAAIASVSIDRTLRAWNAATLQPEGVWHGHEQGIWHLAFSPDGSRIATCSADDTLRLWETSRVPPGTLGLHQGLVFPVAISQDGALAASAGWDHRIQLYDTESLTTFASLPVESDIVWALAFSPDGKRLAAVGQGYFAWSLIDGRPLQAPNPEELTPADRHPIRTLCFFDEHRVILPWSLGQPELRLWDLRDGSITSLPLKAALDLRGNPSATNGRYMVRFPPPAHAPSDPRNARADSGLRSEIVEIASGRVLSLPGITNVTAFAPPSREATLAARLADDPRKILLFDLQEERELGRLSGHNDEVYSIAWSADGERLASGGRDALRIWHRPQLREIVQLHGHRSFVWSVAFHPGARELLISGSGDRSVRSWDSRSQRELAGLRRARTALRSRLRPELSRLLNEGVPPATVLSVANGARELTSRERAFAEQLVLELALR